MYLVNVFILDASLYLASFLMTSLRKSAADAGVIGMNIFFWSVKHVISCGLWTCSARRRFMTFLVAKRGAEVRRVSYA